MPPEGSSAWTRVALVATGIALALLAGEAALRLAPSRGDARTLRALHEPRPDRAWLYGLRPWADLRLRATGGVRYRINADGFRDPPRSKRPPPGTLRLVVLGDSIAFGYGVEQEHAFPARLERLLSRPGARAEVLNLGVNGYNPYTEARLFEDVAIAYAPALVLAQFCVNDLHDPSLHFDVQTRQRLGAIPDAAFPDPAGRRPPPAGLARLCRVSRLCTLVGDRFSIAARSGASERALLASLAPPEQLGPREREWLRARWDETAGAAAAIGAGFAVVAFPHQAQISESAAAGLQRDLVALGRAAGWPVIDLLPAFRAASASNPTLFLDVWHPSAEGHRVAAEAIASRLAELGLPVAPTPQRGSARSAPESRAATSAGP